MVQPTLAHTEARDAEGHVLSVNDTVGPWDLICRFALRDQGRKQGYYGEFDGLEVVSVCGGGMVELLLPDPPGDDPAAARRQPRTIRVHGAYLCKHTE